MDIFTYKCIGREGIDQRRMDGGGGWLERVAPSLKTKLKCCKRVHEIMTPYDAAT
jgi:hypothetical protein